MYVGPHNLFPGSLLVWIKDCILALQVANWNIKTAARAKKMRSHVDKLAQ